MRTRFQVSLNADNPRHQKAASFLAQYGPQRSDYIVSCILLAEQSQSLKDIVRQAFREELGQQTIQSVQLAKSLTTDPEEEKTSLREVPDSLLGFMDQL